jgi:outer membrane protein TolC
LYADVSQLIYDGGMVKEQKKVQELTAAIGNNKVNIELYNLRSRVFQLYFAILLQQELQTQTRLLIHDVQSGIDKVKAQVENGVVLRSNLWLLQAQQLQTSQRMIELQSTRSGLLAALGKLLNVSFDTTLLLKKDDVSFTSDTAIQRPEITLYKSQIALLQSQKQLLSAKNKPRLSAFVQGGYGKPGLNLLSDKFDPYYIGGMRAEWSLGNLYTARRDRKLLGISQQTIDLQRETFLLNTRSQLSQQQAEIDKYQQLIATDKAIIDIRKNISDAAKAQLENAVITSNDYLREINAEDQARQTMIVHEIQSLQAKANYAIISGTL